MKTLLGSRNTSLSLSRKEPPTASSELNSIFREIKADYDAVVPGLFPEAPTYAEAMEIVWPRIKPLIP